MKRRLSILIVFGMLSLFTFTGCEGKINKAEGENSEVTIAPEKPSNNTQTTEQSYNSNTSLSPDAIPEIEIKLDKTYFNKRFMFEVKYPSIWSLIEEKDNPAFPDQGVFVFIENSKESSIDYNNINKIDHIKIFGQVSSIAIPEAGMTIGEFITNDGIKATTYFRKIDGMMNTYYVLEEKGKKSYYGARVCVSEDTNDKYNEVISEILKSVKLIQN